MTKPNSKSPRRRSSTQECNQHVSQFNIDFLLQYKDVGPESSWRLIKTELRTQADSQHRATANEAKQSDVFAEGTQNAGPPAVPTDSGLLRTQMSLLKNSQGLGIGPRGMSGGIELDIEDRSGPVQVSGSKPERKRLSAEGSWRASVDATARGELPVKSAPQPKPPSQELVWRRASSGTARGTRQEEPASRQDVSADKGGTTATIPSNYQGTAQPPAQSRVSPFKEEAARGIFTDGGTASGRLPPAYSGSDGPDRNRHVPAAPIPKDDGERLSMLSHVIQRMFIESFANLQQLEVIGTLLHNCPTESDRIELERVIAAAIVNSVGNGPLTPFMPRMCRLREIVLEMPPMNCVSPIAELAAQFQRRHITNLQVALDQHMMLGQKLLNELNSPACATDSEMYQRVIQAISQIEQETANLRQQLLLEQTQEQKCTQFQQMQQKQKLISSLAARLQSGGTLPDELRASIFQFMQQQAVAADGSPAAVQLPRHPTGPAAKDLGPHNISHLSTTQEHQQYGSQLPAAALPRMVRPGGSGPEPPQQPVPLVDSIGMAPVPAPSQGLGDGWSAPIVGPLQRSAPGGQLPRRPVSHDAFDCSPQSGGLMPVDVPPPRNTSLKSLRPGFPHVLNVHPQKKVWWYVDLEHHVQGPFSAKQMFAWYEAGYLGSTLPIKFCQDFDFIPLLTLFPLHDVDMKEGKNFFETLPLASVAQYCQHPVRYLPAVMEVVKAESPTNPQPREMNDGEVPSKMAESQAEYRTPDRSLPTQPAQKSAPESVQRSEKPPETLSKLKAQTRATPSAIEVEISREERQKKREVVTSEDVIDEDQWSVVNRKQKTSRSRGQAAASTPTAGILPEKVKPVHRTPSDAVPSRNLTAVVQTDVMLQNTPAPWKTAMPQGGSAGLDIAELQAGDSAVARSKKKVDTPSRVPASPATARSAWSVHESPTPTDGNAALDDDVFPAISQEPKKSKSKGMKLSRGKKSSLLDFVRQSEKLEEVPRPNAWGLVSAMPGHENEPTLEESLAEVYKSPAKTSTSYAAATSSENVVHETSRLSKDQAPSVSKETDLVVMQRASVDNNHVTSASSKQVKKSKAAPKAVPEQSVINLARSQAEWAEQAQARRTATAKKTTTILKPKQLAAVTMLAEKYNIKVDVCVLDFMAQMSAEDIQATLSDLPNVDASQIRSFATEFLELLRNPFTQVSNVRKGSRKKN